MINGEPGSALKARGSEWRGPDKSGAGGDKGWRKERGALDALTNHCQRRRPRETARGGIVCLEGTAALHWAELNPGAGAAHCL